MRDAALKTLLEVANEGADVHLLTADLGFRVMDAYRERHPGRFTNCGVAEANMVSVAAGMAQEGVVPICYSMMPFLFMRAFEQVRIDVVEPKRHVVLLGVGSGLSYGPEGPSHHAIEDIAMARALPGLRVVAPGDPTEAAAAVRYAIEHDGPTLIRLGGNGDPKIHPGNVDVTRVQRVIEGRGEVVVLCTGHVLAAASVAVRSLHARGLPATLCSVPMIKPLDRDGVLEATRGARYVATIEEHQSEGGFGSLIAERLFEAGYRGRFEKIGLPERYWTISGSAAWLRKQAGLDAESIAERIARAAG